MADGNAWRSRKFVRSCVTAAGRACLCLCVSRTARGAGAVARCGRASVADLLVAAWLMSTAAAGVFEAKKMQKMLLLPQLGAEDCERSSLRVPV